MGIIIGHVYLEKTSNKKYVFVGCTVNTFTLAGNGFTVKNTLKRGTDFREYFIKNYTYVGSAVA